jgi:phenylalanyl-tRNA synthetase beta chain
MIRVENPMSADQGLLRTTLLGSLLDVARRNVARGTADVAIFEAGAVYPVARGTDPREPPPREPRHLGVLLTGAARPATWREPQPPPADFFAAKGVLALLLDTLRVGWRVEPATEPFLHPGRSAAVLVREGEGDDARETNVGWLGELHPAIAAGWELERVAAFELDLDAVIASAPGAVRYQDYTSFPEVRQDLAVVVPDDVPSGEVVRVVREAGGPLLASAEVFDVYRGEQLGEGMVSLALRLAFRSPERTLTDEDVAARRANIEAALAQLGGSLRA